MISTRSFLPPLLAFLILAGPARADVTVPPAKNGNAGVAGCARLPADWKPAEMATAATRTDTPIVSAQILAWQVDEDDRPLRVERVLLWLKLRDNGPYMLAHIYRHPKSENRWRVSQVYDVPYVGSQSYAKRPGKTELERFIGDSWWHFAATDGFRLLGAEVCAEAWQGAFGKRPWHAYPAR